MLHLVALLATASVDVTRAADDAGPGSRFGIVGTLLGKAGTRGASAMAGIGVRVGFRERPDDDFAFMPAGVLLAGALLETDGDPGGFLETRIELGGAKRGGLLLHAIHGYVSTGISFTRGYYAPLRPAVGPVAVRPYFGLGGGWNWLPKGGLGNLNLGSLGGGGLGGAAAGILVAIVAIPLILAGRIEFRFSPPVYEDDVAEVAAVTGFGF